MSRRSARIVSALTLFAAISFALGAFGAEEAKGGTHMSLLGMILDAGIPEFILIAFSVLPFAIAIQNFMIIKKEAIIPNGLAEGLPTGFQIVGPAFSENRILEAAYALEQAIGFDGSQARAA